LSTKLQARLPNDSAELFILFFGPATMSVFDQINESLGVFDRKLILAVQNGSISQHTEDLPSGRGTTKTELFGEIKNDGIMLIRVVRCRQNAADEIQFVGGVSDLEWGQGQRRE
jgi:hypothetical protein